MPRSPGQPNSTAPRRRDIFEPRAPRVRRPRHRAEALARGVDAAGRFIGDGDVERGFHYFQAARLRTAPA